MRISSARKKWVRLHDRDEGTHRDTGRRMDTHVQSPLVDVSVCLVCRDKKKSDRRKGVCLAVSLFPFLSSSLFISSSLSIYPLLSSFLFRYNPSPNAFSFSSPFPIPFLFPSAPYPRSKGGGSHTYNVQKDKNSIAWMKLSVRTIQSSRRDVYLCLRGNHYARLVNHRVTNKVIKSDIITT